MCKDYLGYINPRKISYISNLDDNFSFVVIVDGQKIEMKAKYAQENRELREDLIKLLNNDFFELNQDRDYYKRNEPQECEYDVIEIRFDNEVFEGRKQEVKHNCRICDLNDGRCLTDFCAIRDLYFVKKTVDKKDL